MAIPQYDPKLDKSYPRTIRCPYCKGRIYAYSTTCKTCGLTKRQIAGASNLEAKKMRKNKEKGKIVMVKRRPLDLDMTKFSLCLCVGFVGAHNFYVGRKVRGWIMAGLMILFVILALVFPDAGAFGPGVPEQAHPFREAFGDFPLFNLIGAIPVMVWFYDIFSIVVFRNFKYPVRISIDKDGKPKDREIEEREVAV